METELPRGKGVLQEAERFMIKRHKGEERPADYTRKNGTATYCFSRAGPWPHRTLHNRDILSDCCVGWSMPSLHTSAPGAFGILFRGTTDSFAGGRVFPVTRCSFVLPRRIRDFPTDVTSETYLSWKPVAQCYVSCVEAYLHSFVPPGFLA